MDDDNSTVDVLIAGGGITGLTLAACLGSAGVRVSIVDQETTDGRLAPAFDGRTTAIALGSMRVLAAAGVWEHVPEHEREAILDIRVADDFGPFFLHYQHEEVGSNPFGWIVENRILRHALFTRLGELACVRHLAPAVLADMTVHPGRVDARLADGRCIKATVLVGADGRRSLVRSLAGIRVWGWPYARQTALVTVIGHSQPHHGVALEHFLPAGPFAVLPMTRNRSSIVWTERKDRADRYLALPDALFSREIVARAGNWLGQVGPIGQRFSYALSVQCAHHYIANRIALVGEAVHTIHPIAGQGLNLGLRDVAALTEVLVDALRLGQDPGDSAVLARYQQWRRPDNLALVAVTDGLNRLFSTALPPIRLLRGLGLAAVNQAPFVRQLLMRHAMGTLGDLPRLLRGEPV